MQTISKAIVLIILAFAGASTAQQSVKRFVRENMDTIRSISPYTSNYSDFEGIGNAIGNARFVLLGEQSHGDAAAFQAKVKLVKYLREVKGFTVLAFESDFFGLNEGWDNIQKTPSEIDYILRGNVLPIWSRCDACQTLFDDYIPGTYLTDNPLHITGFDNQLFCNHSFDFLAEKVDSVLRSYDLPITKTAEYASNIIPYIDSLTKWFGPYQDTSQYSRSDAHLKQIKQQLGIKLKADDFWMMIIDNLISLNTVFRFHPTNQYATAYVARDKQMTANLSWLSRVKYPNKKIIVWAHNYHVAKQFEDYSEKRYGYTTMGGFMSRDSVFMDHMYVVGFTSYTGNGGMMGNPKYALPIKKNSFESWVDKNMIYGFIDFTSYPGSRDKLFMMKGEGHYHAKEDWMKKYDGCFYIRTMYPCFDIKGD